MANFPTGTYIFSDSAIPSGWINYTTYGGKYIRGSADAEHLGYIAGAATHVHASASLSSVTGHNHGGSVSADTNYVGNKYVVGGTHNLASSLHRHHVWANITNNLSHTHTVGETGTADNDPSHTVLMLLRKS